MTIGIPTYNRAASLVRAVDSCRAQSYPNIAIVVADNASNDDTPSLCDEWARADRRVRVIRQPTNVGRERNFGAVLEASAGGYFMWLSDDDWIEPDYVSACARQLTADPDCVMAGGRARYFLPDGRTFSDASVNLTNLDPAARILRYLATVYLNGTYYGVMRRDAASQAEYPMTLAGDWYFVAQIAAVGKIAQVPEAVLHRSASGDSSRMDTLPLDYGLPRWCGKDLHIWALILLVPAILSGRGTFAAMSLRSRIWLAIRLTVVLKRRWWHHFGRRRVGIHALGRLRRRVATAVSR